MKNNAVTMSSLSEMIRNEYVSPNGINSHRHECTNVHTHQLLLNLMCADGVAEPQVTNTQSDVLVSSNESARLELSSADR